MTPPEVDHEDLKEPIHEHTGRGTNRIFYTYLRKKPLLYERSSVPADLSGSAVTLVVLHTEKNITIERAWLLYTEASSADAGITVEIGKESDRDYFYVGTSEISKAIWYTNEVTLLKKDLLVGDTLTFYSPGGKTGTGEIICVIQYRF